MDFSMSKTTFYYMPADCLRWQLLSTATKALIVLLSACLKDCQARPVIFLRLARFLFARTIIQTEWISKAKDLALACLGIKIGLSACLLRQGALEARDASKAYWARLQSPVHNQGPEKKQTGPWEKY